MDFKCHFRKTMYNNWERIWYLKDVRTNESKILSLLKVNLRPFIFILWALQRVGKKWLPLYCPFSFFLYVLACMNYMLFKALDFYQSPKYPFILHGFLFPLKGTSWFLWYFYTLCFIVFLQYFPLDAKVQMLWLLLRAQDICFPVGSFLSFIPNYNLYVPLRKYRVRSRPCKNEYFSF